LSVEAQEPSDSPVPLDEHDPERALDAVDELGGQRGSAATTSRSDVVSAVSASGSEVRIA
jgi:hypothetical protein